MTNQIIDLTICQLCKENPAVYGDGLTWSRCAKCELARNKSAGNSAKYEAPKGEGFEHKIVEGLTSIIIPVYINTYALFHYTGNCIGSVRENTMDDYEIVIVDNGSPIKPPNINSYYAQRVIINESNFGVTKAWNQGIRTSVGEYIVLLNNDVQVYGDWLGGLMENLDDYDLVMAHPMYSLTEPFARAIESMKIRDKVTKSTKLFSDFKDFSCVMFKRSLIDEIGLFDEQFFNYCSDIDFIKRLEAAGKKITCVDYVAVSHLSDATGISIKETPQIMNEDKAKFKKKWENESDRALIRTIETGDSIFLLKDKTVHHIENPETLRALGYDFGNEMLIDFQLYNGYKKGESINMQNYERYT